MFKLRFWKVVFLSFFRLRDTFKSSVGFWVTPFDLDIYLHLNNAFYLKYMDMGRWDLILRSGVVKHLVRARIQPVVVNIEIDYRRSLNLGNYFVLKTEFDSHTEKVLKFRQKFYRGSELMAEATASVVFLKHGKVIPVSQVNEALPPELVRAILPQ